MAKMISNLPMDLIEDIISRVPLESMKAVRLTCQSWNNLSKSESFKKMHIGKATREGENMVITMMPQNIYLMSGVFDDVDPSIELKGELSYLHNQVSISRVLHYEGLLLCILKDLTKIVVCNPYLGQTRWIDLRYSHRGPYDWDMFSYALGYEDKESRSGVKFLRFVDYFFRAPERQFFWYEIYDFDSGLWTTLDVTPYWKIYCSSDSVSLKGNTYWYAKERSSQCPKDYIICFDFTKERFGPLLPLPNIVDHEYRNMALSCVKEEKLAALFQQYGSHFEFEIWITNKIEVEMVSWSKFLRMDTKPKIGIPISFFIDDEKKDYMGFDIVYDSDYPKIFINIIGEAGYSRKLDLGVQLPADRDCQTEMCAYVPSLIQIKEPARGKRKRQSSLEKRRFDQNMLRLAAFEKDLYKQYTRGGRSERDC